MTTQKKIIIGIVALAFLYILYTMFFKKGGNDSTSEGGDTKPISPEERKKMLDELMAAVQGRGTMTAERVREIKTGLN